MAINENQENLEQEPQEVVEETPTMETPEKVEGKVEETEKTQEKPQEVVEKVAEAPKPEPTPTEKPKSQFPHQLLMEKHNLTVKGLSEKTKEYLGDFEDFMKHVKMAKTSAERKGNEYVLSEAKKNKLIRLSKSVCTCINDIIDAENEIKEEEKRKKEQGTRERLLFRQKRREMMNKTQEERKAQEKRKKEEEEDDTYGFFF